MARVKKKDGYIIYPVYLYFSAEGKVRMTKTPSGSYHYERMCKTEFAIPESAFKTPEYKAVISFDSDAEHTPIDANIVKDAIESNLHDFPVIIDIVCPETAQ